MQASGSGWRLAVRVGLALVLAGCGGAAVTDGGTSGASAAACSAGALPDPADLFTWTTAEKIVGFSHTAGLFATEPFRAGERADRLKRGALPAFTYEYGGRRNTIDDYFAHTKAAALLILKGDTIVAERYAPGITEDTLWESKSVGKSVVSTLIGVALKQGKIRALDDTVERYLPELVGTAYEGVTLRDMLRMASGVQWNEDYLDPSSDFNAVYGCIVRQAPSCVLPIMRSLPRALDPATGAPAVPGAIWNYSTGEAHLLGLVLQRATGRSLAQYLEDAVWRPCGMERDGLWIRESQRGPDFGGIGFNATLRDYGRFGQFVMNDGALPHGGHALPHGWVREATTWTAPSSLPGYADNGQYGYLWWFSPAYDDGINLASPLSTRTPAPPQNTTATVVAPMTGTTADWTFAAIGIFGQMIAINQREHVVFVQWATWDRPDPLDLAVDPSDPYNEQSVFINAVIDALH